jgi:hypothetical protein
MEDAKPSPYGIRRDCRSEAIHSQPASQYAPPRSETSRKLPAPVRPGVGAVGVDAFTHEPRPDAGALGNVDVLEGRSSGHFAKLTPCCVGSGGRVAQGPYVVMSKSVALIQTKTITMTIRTTG